MPKCRVTADTTALQERIAEALAEHWRRKHSTLLTSGPCSGCSRVAADAVAVEVRKAKAEAFDSFCNALADHLDLGTPRAWGFHHPCDPPGVRWEPTERDRALMDVADMIRNDTLNPYTEKETA